MSNKIFSTVILISMLIVSGYFISCNKKDASPTPTPPTDVCAGKTIAVTPTATSSTACGAVDGNISVAATGSTGFTFKLNSGGLYQASGTFTNIAAGTYTVFAKDAAGCEKSASVTVNSSGAAGPFFTNVRNLMTARCQSCHNNTVQNGGMNWQTDCNIVINQARIKARAVDRGTMPPTGSLSQADKDIITNWINAGGKLTD